MEPDATSTGLGGEAASWASSAAVRKTMQGNRRRDTVPEIQIRRLLHASGLRYRVDWPLPFDRRRRADIVFIRRKVVVFIDGCFWHRCPLHYVPPKTNSEFWERKTAGNAARDLETTGLLAAAGWTVLRFWEHVSPEAAAAGIAASVAAAAMSVPKLRENTRRNEGGEPELPSLEARDIR